MPATNTQPVFSGNPEDMNAFVTMILEDMTTEQLAYYAVQKYASESVTTASGYVLPPAPEGGLDAVAGIDTDFPLPVHVGMSWDKVLAEKIGRVIGDERRGQVEAANPNTLLYTGEVDVHLNPLAGRYNEGYSEDPFLSDELCDAVCSGIHGEDEFYIKTMNGIKHFSTYDAEWDRLYKTTYISSRPLREFQFPPFFKSITSGHTLGVMTSFNAINGIPNAYSPYLKVIRDKAKYSLFHVSDYNGDANTLDGLGNGYDEAYAKTGEQIAALMIKAGSYSNNIPVDPVTVEHYIRAVENQLFGITVHDLREHIRPLVEIWVRCGYFNQNAYPYQDLCADYNPVTSASADHQAIALQAAQGGMVLLKNENAALPLSGDSSVVVTGMFADSRSRAFYAITTPDGIEHAGVTPLEAIRSLFAEHKINVTYAPDITGKKLILKDPVSKKYLTADPSTGSISASGAAQNDATVFQMYDFGMDSYSFCDENAVNFWTITDGVLTMSEWNKTSTPSGFSYEDAGDGKVYIRSGCIIDNTLTQIQNTTPFYQVYTEQGNFLTADADSGLIKLGPSISDGYENAPCFEATVVDAAGSGPRAEAYAVDHDVAIAFVGSDPQINQGENSDRPRLALGEDQLELIQNLSKSFDQVIVVIRSDSPLGIAPLKDNPFPNAILYYAYAGEFDSWAAAQTLVGEHNPSGRLNGTWLKDTSSLPPLTDRTEDVDPRYTVNMKDADPQQLGLTYQYNDPADVVYPFGYGLSYTSFDQTLADASETDRGITIQVTVTNTGDCSGADVVQIYAAQESSAAYKTFIPNHKLVGFAKTRILEPGEVQTLTIEILKETLMKWNTITQDYFLEEGSYILSMGMLYDNLTPLYTYTVTEGSLGMLDLSEAKNVWDSAYGSKDMKGIEVSKARTLAFAGDYFAVESLAADSYIVLPAVDLTGKTTICLRVASELEHAVIKLYADTLASAPLAEIQFTATDPVTYNLDNEETIPVTELGYTTVSATLNHSPDTPVDLYLKLKQAGIRIDSIQAQ